MKRKFAFIVGFTIIFFTFPVTVIHATQGIPATTVDGNPSLPATNVDGNPQIPATTVDGNSTGLPNPLKVNNLVSFIKLVIDQVLKFAEIISALLIIWSGFLFVKAQGDPKELETARRNFFYVVIGTGILLAAHVITDIIINTINQLK